MRELGFVFFLSFFLLPWDGIFFASVWFAMCASMVFSFVVGVGVGIFDSSSPDHWWEPRLAECARNIWIGWRVPNPNGLRCALHAVDAHKVQYRLGHHLHRSPLNTRIRI